MSEEKKSANNFFFSGIPNHGVLNRDDNDSLKFIILQNDTFHLQVQTLTSEVNKLKQQNYELEEDNQKFEEGKIALRSYLKNEVIHRNLFKRLNKIYNDKARCLTEVLFYERCLTFLLYLFTISNVLYPELLNFTPVAFIAIMSSYLIKYKTIFNFAEFEVKVKEIKKEIVEVNKGNNLLDQLIDDL